MEGAAHLVALARSIALSVSQLLGIALEARAGEFEKRVDYLVLGPAGFRCPLSQFLKGRFQGVLALKAAIRMVDRAARFHDRNA